MQEQLTIKGRFETPNASRYLQQLCKHFGHKIDVRFDEHSGEIALSAGPAALTATDTELVVFLKADDAEGLERSCNVIDNHLERFAFREAFKNFDWDQIET